MGRNDVEDALLRLDMLTKEESLMVMARNLEVTHQIDDVVHDVDDNVKAIKVLTEDIDDNVKEIQGVARNVDSGTQHFLSVFAHLLTLYRVST